MLKHIVFGIDFDLFNQNVGILLRVITKVERTATMATLAKTCIA
jgi:hypothetical protein